MKKLLFVGFCAFSISSTVWSQPELVRDISSAPAGIFGNKAYATDEQFIAAGQFLYFPVTDQKGKELWRTDGTSDGTIRVADINKGTADSYKMGVGLPGNTFEFVTQPGPGEIYSKLWKTNGVDEPALVGTIQDGNDALDVRNIWLVNGNVMILGLNGPAVVLMKHSDSPLAVFKELANNENITVSGSEMIGSDFLVLALQHYENFVYETEFWITDGTDVGTRKIITYPDAVENFIAQGNDIIFENSIQQLLKLNVSTGDITELHDFSTTSIDRLFSFKPAASLISTREGVWITGGTSANTVSLLDNVVDVVEVFVSGSKAYFVGFNQSNTTYNLYETDGTVGGTKLIQKTRDNEATPYMISPPQIGVIGDIVIIPVTTSSGMEIATVNANGKSVIKDINEGVAGSDPHMFVTFNDKIFFAADDGVNGMEVWITDGTEAGTSLLKNIAEGTGNGVRALDLFAMNDEIFFSASSTGLNHDIWKTTGHGTDAEQYFVTNSGNILGNTADTIYFLAQPMQIYKSTGNNVAPKLVADLSTSVGDALHPSSNFFLGEKFIYNMLTLGGSQPYGQELWTIDPHAEGTEVLKDINPGLGDGVFGVGYGETEQRVAVISATQAVFAANDGTNGTELWTTDGTTAGTTMLKDINAGSGSSNPRKIGALLNNKLYFSADDDTHGDELWVTDGTPGGTKMVIDLNPGGSAQISNIAAMDNAVYFIGNDGNEWALFKTTGTANALKVGVLSDPSSEMIVMDHKLYIAGTGSLWVSDGTGITGLDIGATPANLYAFGNQVYFSANEQLWHSKGTANATQMLFDIEPLKFKQSGDLLFMTAASKDYGIELFRMSAGSKFKQEIVFAVEDKTLDDDDFELAATTSSGLMATYEVVSGNVEIDGNMVHIVGPGSVTIKATQPGDNVFEPAEEVTATFCVKPAKPVITASQPSLTSSATEGNQWYLDGTAIEGATGQTLSVTDEGNYTVQVSVDGCESEMSDVSIIVGIAKETNPNTIYPNPVERTLFVNSPAFIRILDSNGRVVFNQSVNESIDVALLSPGMYIAILDGTQYIRFIKR